jgi:glycerate 2-kinase
MFTSESFRTYTLTHHPHGEAVTRILAAAIQAVEPQAAVRNFVERHGQTLLIEGREYHLDKKGRILLLGVGKASHAMTLPLVDLLADHSPRGLLIPKQTPIHPLSGFDIQPGGHPVPDENSLRAGEKAMQLTHGLTENDLLICLISGGGSALMSAPHVGISLSDLRELTSSLLACGARIDEINTLRRHLDQLKGGGLAKLASPAQVVSLILSDVVDSPLEAIASGPTAPDPFTRADALAVLEKYELQNKIPAVILKALETVPETPKPGDGLFEHVQNVIVGSNPLAAQSALEQAKTEGFHPQLLGNDWQGEAREVSQNLCDILKNAINPRPFCLVAGGETTVTLHGGGRGGRNQELALAAVRKLDDMSNVLLVTLATDGEDGPTDAAGAVVSGESYKRGLSAGISPKTFLSDNDAYTYFSALNDLLKIGPSGTNVNDLTFLFGF